MNILSTASLGSSFTGSYIKKTDKLWRQKDKEVGKKEGPSNKTPALTKTTNTGIWFAGTSNQLFIRGS